MGIFSKKERIDSNNWWKNYHPQFKIDNNYNLYSLPEEKQKTFVNLCNLAVNEFCCLSVRVSHGIKQDLIISQALFDNLLSQNSYYSEKQSEINKVVAKNILEANARKSGRNRDALTLYYNDKRLKVFEHYKNSGFHGRVVAAMANRTECPTYLNEITSAITFHICNSLELELSHDEKKKLFDFLEIKFVEVHKNLSKIKLKHKN